MNAVYLVVLLTFGVQAHGFKPHDLSCLDLVRSEFKLVNDHEE